MPRMGGLETMRDLRKINPTAKILLISGAVGEGNFDHYAVAQNLGADALLRKPFARASLVGLVRQILIPGAKGHIKPLKLKSDPRSPEEFRTIAVAHSVARPLLPIKPVKK